MGRLGDNLSALHWNCNTVLTGVDSEYTMIGFCMLLLKVRVGGGEASGESQLKPLSLAIIKTAYFLFLLLMAAIPAAPAAKRSAVAGSGTGVNEEVMLSVSALNCRVFPDTIPPKSMER